MTIANDHVVAIDYILKDNDGKLLDQSEPNDPLRYLHGHQNIIPGLEEALLGKKVGDELEVRIAAIDAYGEVEEELVQEVPIEQFGDMEGLAPGIQVQAQTSEGPVVFTVTEVKEDSVIVDGNHPLAGMDLNFSVRVVDIRKAADEEIAHGHVH